MATCAVSGTIVDGSEAGVSGVTVEAHPVNPYFSSTSLVIPKAVSTTSDSSGNWTLNLSRTGQFQVTIMYPPNAVDSARRAVYLITVPATSTATFSTLATEL